MVDRSQSTKFVKQVIINRVITLSICLICALSLFYLYVVDITAPDGRDLRWFLNVFYGQTKQVNLNEKQASLSFNHMAYKL